MEAIHSKQWHLDKRVKSLSLFLLEGSWFFALNCLTPRIVDDFGAHMNNYNFVELISRVYQEYMNSQVRVVSNFFKYSLANINGLLFDILNTIVFVIFMRAVFYHATYGSKLRKRDKVLLYILLHISMMLFVIGWGQVFLWLSGSANYLWTGTIMLLYLVPFRKAIVDLQFIKSKWFAIFMFLFGFLAGFCNENTSGGIIFLSIAFSAFFFVKIKRISPYMISGFVGSILGFAMMIFGPGAAKRSAMIYNAESILTRGSIWDQFIARFQNLTNIYWSNLYLLIVMVAVILALLFMIKRNYEWFSTLLYALSSVLTCYALLMSPEAPGRSLFGSTFFLVIAFISGSAILLQEDSKKWILFVGGGYRFSFS